MKKIAFAFAAAVTLAAVPALADDAPATSTTEASATATPAPAAAGGGSSGVEVGLRLGYALPMGSVAKAPDPVGEQKLGDLVKGAIPIWLDVGYRLNPNIYLGAYFQYGIVSINKDSPANSACNKSGVDCSASSMTFGVMGAYHIMPDQTFDPWVGLGVGYEMLSGKASAGGVESKSSFSGLQFANLQVGGDYRVNKNLGIGPFVSFAIGQYGSCTSDPGGKDCFQGVDKAMHEWLTIGVRGAYGIW